MIDKAHSDKKGFTLIEILIALTILGIGLVAVLGYLPLALESSKRSADLTVTALIAQKCIEEIKAAAADDITAADAYDTSGAFLEDSDFSGFSYLIDVGNSGAANTKEVTVTVRWNFKGKYYTETFKTMIVKYNPN